MHVQNMGLVPYNRTEEKEREKNHKKTCHNTEKGRKVITLVAHKHSSVDPFNYMPFISIYFHSCILGLHGLKPKSKENKDFFWQFAGTQDPSSQSVLHIHAYSVSRQEWSTTILSFKSQNQNGGCNFSTELY